MKKSFVLNQGCQLEKKELNLATIYFNQNIFESIKIA